MSAKHQYINRELSWLEFNHRVMEQAACKDNPLLERLKFLAITGSNLDEFFMVRVGGLKILSKTNSPRTDISGLNVEEELSMIRERVQRLYRGQADCLLNSLEPELQANNICRLTKDTLSESQKEYLKLIFKEQIESVIAPISVHREQEFPLLVGAGVCLCVRVKNDPQHRIGPDSVAKEGLDRFTVIPLGRTLPRFIFLPAETGVNYVLLEDVVTLFLADIFGNQEILDWNTFRITRNADISTTEDVADDLLLELKEMLAKRNVSDCVRLEIAEDVDPATLNFLKDVLSVSDSDVYAIHGPLNLASYFSLATLQGFHNLKAIPWPSQQSPDFITGTDIFEIISESDCLLLHPYQSYDPVVEYVRTAATDPQVIAIKQTLYRTAEESEIISALVLAAENGKHVTAIVELKARFDELQNMQGAKLLEQAGVDVIYGVEGLKTHAKLCIVVRREERGIQRYVHFATGNYNESTASVYSDISYFTNNQQLGNDAVHFFNAITGLSVPQQIQFLSAAPINLREKLTELINAEAQNAEKGGTGAIEAKMNSLVDQKIIDALYAASQSGVKIKLNIRGICCLKPGVKGLSENIQVISIIDRFLEHARVFLFENGGNQRLFISSADWMNRNLDRRVELMVPIIDPVCKKRLTAMLRSCFQDNIKSRYLDAEGNYHPNSSANQKPYRMQETLYKEACDTFSAVTNPKATVFKARRS